MGKVKAIALVAVLSLCMAGTAACGGAKESDEFATAKNSQLQKTTGQMSLKT